MSQTALVTDIPLWDRIIILASTSPNDVPFFKTPKGIPDANVPTGPPKTLVDTNLGKASQLSDPESFTVHELSFQFEPGTLEADMNKIFQTSYLDFRTSGDTITAWWQPTFLVPAGTGYSYSTTTPAQNGFPSVNAVLKLVRPIELFIGEEFLVYLRFAPGSPGSGVVGAAAALSANVKARIRLGGDHWNVDVKEPELDGAGKPTGKTISTRRSAGGRGQ